MLPLDPPGLGTVPVNFSRKAVLALGLVARRTTQNGMEEIAAPARARL
jgi:hypothetical protein